MSLKNDLTPIKSFGEENFKAFAGRIRSSDNRDVINFNSSCKRAFELAQQFANATEPEVKKELLAHNLHHATKDLTSVPDQFQRDARALYDGTIQYLLDQKVFDETALKEILRVTEE